MYKYKRNIYISVVFGLTLVASEVGGVNMAYDIPESWNMAYSYYKRIDDILTHCMRSRMANNGNGWFTGIQSLYYEVYPKMTDEEKIDAKKMLDDLTANVKIPNKKSVDTKLFMELELFLRSILERKGMLTPKKDLAGL